jgi:inosine/xanthosine triphosphate pyrophosphatase family protein
MGDPAQLPDVSEDAVDAVGNARRKAIAFAAALGAPCLAMDASLHLPDLSAELQPGVNVRRLPGRTDRPDDDEVLAYYTDLCRRHGNRLWAEWEFGFAIAWSTGRCTDRTASVQRVLVAPPSNHRRAGYPLDSLQQDPSTGRYLADFTDDEEVAMWREAIGRPLQDFVEASMQLLNEPADGSRTFTRRTQVCSQPYSGAE